MADDQQPYQSLYRRYRPQRFADVKGQEHITKALLNVVREGTEASGYLFSGPRGTGKTTTARLLAKAVNCTKLDDGEPCGTCDSCTAIVQGTSFDVIELDAASNRGIDAMRDLVSRSALGSGGRRKVYIIDEVHQLTADASGALLKTLEEPPAHVVFVLATTDPQKVLPTIKSRVQHFEFHLFPPDELAALVRSVHDDAGLSLTDDDIERVVARGRGSARDALSALDQAAALGGTEHEVPVADEVAEALCDRDPGRALVAVAEGCAGGRDPRRLTEEILEHLRNAFLSTMARSLVQLPPTAATRVEDQARRLGTAALVRAMEVLGTALAEMRDALDPRITLEVALVRVTAPNADVSPAALLERLERIERRLADGQAVGATPSPAGVAPSPASATPAAATPPVAPPVRPAAERPAPADSSPPAGRAALGAHRRGAPQSSGQAPPTAAGPTAAPPTRSAPRASAPAAAPRPAGARAPAPMPSRDELTKAWGDAVLGSLKPRAKALYSSGRFLSVDGEGAVFALPNAAHRQNCEPLRSSVEAALAAHFGADVPMRLVVDGSADPGSTGSPEPAPTPPDDDESYHPADLEDAPPALTSVEERLKQAFPGAREVER